MYKPSHSKGNISWFTVLSLGFIILGIGCMTWAIYSIWTQSGYYSNDDINRTEYTVDEDELNDDNMESSSSDSITVQDKALYSIYPVEGDEIGYLNIPTLNLKLLILQGTGDDELKKGVGHFNQSVLPGEKDNCVFSGHRETAFSQIGKLNIGDQLIVTTSAGTFTYEVNGTRIVDEDDRTVIVPTENAILTMTTCYPFNFIGNAPDRYIVSAELVESKLNN